MTKVLLAIAFVLAPALVHARAALSLEKLASLSQETVVYVGDNIDSTVVYQDGRETGRESFDHRYGSSPAILNSIVRTPLTESFVLTHPTASEYVFVYLHGITDSAFQGKDLARELFNAGHNVISARLSGHGSDSSRVNTIELEDWRSDVDQAVLKAAQLGKKVVLIGLSTGAALAVDRAFRNPIGIEAIIPIAPAIGIANRFVNLLEKMRLFPLIAALKPYVGAVSDEQVEVRQLNKGSHSVHVLYQLGMAVQREVRTQTTQVRGLIVTSDQDTAIQAERIPELLASMPNGEWLNIVERASQHEPVQAQEGRRITLTVEKAPIHSGLVYAPKYIAHVDSDVVAAEEGARPIVPFATSLEANLAFPQMMTKILQPFATCQGSLKQKN